VKVFEYFVYSIIGALFAVNIRVCLGGNPSANDDVSYRRLTLKLIKHSAMLFSVLISDSYVSRSQNLVCVCSSNLFC